MPIIPYEVQVVQIQGFSCLQAPDFGECWSLCSELGVLAGQSFLTWLILPRGELGLKRHKKVEHGVVRQALSRGSQHY